MKHDAAIRISEKGERVRAFHDALTLLPNSRFFRARLEQVLDRPDPPHQSIAVLYIGLGDLGQFFETNGRDVTDALLKAVGARLSASVRAEDLLSRIGGEEFACLSPGFYRPDQLSGFALKMIRTLSEPLQIGMLRLCVHSNIDIAVWPGEGVTADALLMKGKLAMHRPMRDGTDFAFAGRG